MPRESLLDFFDDFSTLDGPFLIYDDGYRTRTHSYREVGRAARGFAARLGAAGIAHGDKVLIWSENRPEWIVAFWGCLLAGAIVVPVDYRASIDFLLGVSRIVRGRVVVIGDETPGLPPEAARGPEGPAVWRLAEIDWSDATSSPRAPATQDAVAEIVFTSGATAEPKGVVITHRNILANIVPVEREILKYRRYGRPFFPLRFLNLLPLSHMFGQAMATFVPPMLPGVVLFMRGYNPSEIVRQIKKRRVSVMVSVPKILDVLREHVLRVAPPAADSPARTRHVLRRWWQYRSVHRLFGFKFWSFVVGAAPLDPALEEFWSRLGFLVIQGYGLTETAPIVSLNHPFHTGKGSVGKAIAGVEIRIAPDGEILVRGENVTSGYFKPSAGGGVEPAPAETAADGPFENGWFHTGDVGEIDSEGQLFIRGRKKEMIVTPEGLNVFPEDVERIVDAVAGVRESAAVGLSSGGEERVHVALVLDSGAEAEQVVRQANARLADHQRIRGASVWPDRELPRTEGTRKLKRREIREWLQTGAPARPAAASPEDTFESIVGRYAGRRALPAGATLEELGLSSLERVELMVALEDRFETAIDEAAFAGAKSLGELRALVERPAARQKGAKDAGAAGVTRPEPVDFPSWNRSAFVSAIRRVSLKTWLVPLTRLFAWISTEGRERLSSLEGPVVFAANHQSHMDTPVILAALPPRWRSRVAPAMAKEFFKAHFFPEQHTRRQWLTSTLNYYLAAFFFNAFPIPQREAGARQTLRYIGELLSEGYSVLIYPEGMRTDTGEIKPFRPGIGMIASRLDAPVVPVRLEGVDRVLHQSWAMARPGPVRVKFGQPLRLRGDDYGALAKQVEEAVRAL